MASLPQNPRTVKRCIRTEFWRRGLRVGETVISQQRACRAYVHRTHSLVIITVDPGRRRVWSYGGLLLAGAAVCPSSPSPARPRSLRLPPDLEPTALIVVVAIQTPFYYHLTRSSSCYYPDHPCPGCLCRTCSAPVRHLQFFSPSHFLIILCS